MYNVFQWQTLQNAKLAVIGIANTMDLPERLLPKVASRLGTTRVVFKAYRKDDLIQIIKQRLSDTMVFSNDAIGYCSMSVAGVSGDCRAALQICQRAVEIAKKDLDKNILFINTKQIKKSNNKDNKNTQYLNYQCLNENDIVTLQHVKQAKIEINQSNDIQIINTLSIYEKLFLTAVIKHNLKNEIFSEKIDIYRRKFDNFINTRLNDERMKNTHFRNLLERLEEMGIITIIFDKVKWIEYIKLNITLEQVANALQQNIICANILSN